MEGSVSSKHLLYIEMLKHIKELSRHDLEIIQAKKDITDDEIALRELMTRLFLSVDVAILSSQKCAGDDLQAASMSFHSLSEVMEEMVRGLSDAETPGEYDPEEWSRFTNKFNAMMGAMMDLYNLQAAKRIKGEGG